MTQMLSIESLQEQLLLVDKSEKDLNNKLDVVAKFKSAINKTIQFYASILFIFVFVIVMTIVIIVSKSFKLSTFFYCLLGSVYAYAIIVGILDDFFKNKAQLKHFGRFKITETEIEELNKLKNNLTQEKRKLIEQIFYVEEKQFIEKLEKFIKEIEHKKKNLNEAIKISKLLEEENLKIKSNKYQIHREIFYLNRFEKINHILKNYDSDLNNIEATQKIDSPKSKEKTEIIQTINLEDIVGEDKINQKNTFLPTSNSAVEIDNKNKIEIVNDTIIPSQDFNDSVKPDISSNNSEVDKTIINKELELANDVDKSLPDLFKPQIEKDTYEKKSKQFLIKFKPDYLEIHKTTLNIGELGELFALKKEKERLTRVGLEKLTDKIMHSSKENDTLGYDIISFSNQNTKRYIEVKTTTDTHKTPFYLSEGEIIAMKELDNYFIYRIYNFDINSVSGDFYILDCKKDFKKYFNIEAVSYKVFPK